MRILHLLSDGQTGLSMRIIEAQSKDNIIKVIDLTKKELSYPAIIDEIFSNNRVICW